MIEEYDNHLDDPIDAEIGGYVNLSSLRSFFLFAGAGSGKTRTLVNVLKDYIIEPFEHQLAMEGRKVAIITYTNAATEEIHRRADYHPLIHVSTIHSFAWSVIKGFHKDIRKWLKHTLAEKIEELNKKQTKAKNTTTKTYQNRAKEIETKSKRLAQLEDILIFQYNPNGNLTGIDSLSHAEVIQIAADFLKENKTMRNIIASQFPIVLIDESQDTNKNLVDAFFALHESHKDRISIGFIGDVMQRIYADGKEGLGSGLSDEWAKPIKRLNHRSSRRVVKLINNIRKPYDGISQLPRTDAIEGNARLFISHRDVDKSAVEQSVMSMMAKQLGDDTWSDIRNIKLLTLEHHMAAKRLGFSELYEPLRKEFSTAIADGSLPALNFFKQVMMLVNANKIKDNFTVANLLQERSPLFSVKKLKVADNQIQHLSDVKEKVLDLLSLWDESKDPTLREVLIKISEHNIFELPEQLKSVSIEANELDEMLTEIMDEEPSALDLFLNAPFSQIQKYYDYIEGNEIFDTHQGVKGLEFPKVMVIIDDEEARGFLYKYDKLLGTKEKSATDIENEEAGKDNAIDRARRLFYVTCSRAKEDLAIITYTDTPDLLKQNAIAQKWFSEDEIHIL
ncbi:MAG: ATP-dependent helicase [Methylocystaceae bacterium]|nr:ATP-dependent helicase [Methylocystaceae bacterium]